MSLPIVLLVGVIPAFLAVLASTAYSYRKPSMYGDGVKKVSESNSGDTILNSGKE